MARGKSRRAGRHQKYMYGVVSLITLSACASLGRSSDRYAQPASDISVISRQEASASKARTTKAKGKKRKGQTSLSEDQTSVSPSTTGTLGVDSFSARQVGAVADSAPSPISDTLLPTSSADDSLRAEGVLPSGLDSLGGSMVQLGDGATEKRDSIQADSLPQAKSKMDGFDDIIEYKAQDSIVMLGTNMAYLFGPSTVDYKDKGLEANYMRMNIDSNLVFAHYTLDSVGNPTAHPKFKDGGESYEAKSMNYNFKTEKGFITGVITQQGEGYVTAEKTKKDEHQNMYLAGGRYTTCSDHEHPHFYLQLTKGKVRPGKNIVTGPCYLVVGDVPLPIGLPFGFFPFSSRYSSGIIMPKYGDESNRGIYLREGGYYWAINDYVDLAVTGDWYSRGSWGARAHSNYRKRYRYSGTFDVSYMSNKLGDKDVAGSYTESNDFRINWTHTQDSKANPNQTFSASVNYSTSNYNHNSLNTLYNPLVAGQDTKSSSINYSRTFVGTPWRLSLSVDATQSSRDSMVTMSLPNLSVSMSRIFPFKRKQRVGAERWYEKIAISYSGEIRNSISTKENKLFKSNLIKDWRNGVRHSIPISASFKLFDYIDLTLSANYNERWYASKVKQSYDATTQQVVRDTIYGFNRAADFSTSASLSTTMYGFFKPWKIFGDKVQMIRHRINPRIGVSFSPDFSDPMWGVYQSYMRPDANGNMIEQKYSLYEGALFGSPAPGKSASINFGLDNNLEMKVRSRKDTTGKDRKVSLIDNFSISSSYNLAADSFHLSDISARLNLKLSKSFNLSLSGSFDPYMYGHVTKADGSVEPIRINKLRMFNGKGIGSLRGTGTSFSYTFNNETFAKLRRLFGKGTDEKGKDKGGSSPDLNDDASPNRFGDTSMGDMAAKNGGNGQDKNGGSLYGKRDEEEYDADGYAKVNIPWSLSINYGVNLNRVSFDPNRDEYNYGLSHSLMFSGNIQPTKNWSFNFNASYDFEAKKLANMTIGISRSLHCWTFTASAIPIGPYKSYNFTIGVNSSMLRDLKYDKHSYPSNGTWY